MQTHILIIDTATPTLTLAVVVSGKITTQTTTDSRRADRLLNELDSLLTTCALARTDLTEIWVRTGLGSYTGIRVGVSVANALGWSLQLPVLGFLNNQQIPTDIEQLLIHPPRSETNKITDHWPELIPAYQPWPEAK